MKLVITGVPGSGKTTLAKALAKKLGAEYIDFNALAKKHAVLRKVEKEYEINLAKLKATVRKFTRGKTRFVLEGHLACEVKIPCDAVVILRCNPLVLMKRLAKRKYRREKITDNALAEAEDYFVFKVEENYGKNYVEVDTTRKVSVETLLWAVKKGKSDKINWKKELFALASQGL